jgi:hypothetical protein
MMAPMQKVVKEGGQASFAQLQLATSAFVIKILFTRLEIWSRLFVYFASVRKFTVITY